MEQVLQFALSSTYGYCALAVAVLGGLMYAVWAMYLPPDNLRLKTLGQVAMGIAVMALLFWVYARVMVSGLHGVAGIASPYSSDTEWFFHRLQPWAFWGALLIELCIVASLGVLTSGLMIAAACGERRAGRKRERAGWASTQGCVSKQDDAERRKSGGVFNVIVMAAALLVVFSMACVGRTLDRQGAVRAQVAAGLKASSWARQRVEAFVRDHGELPNDVQSARLQADTSVKPGRYVSSVEFVSGSVLLTYGGSDADARIRGKQLVVVAVARGHEVIWHCVDMTLDPRYLPDSRPACVHDGLLAGSARSTW